MWYRDRLVRFGLKVGRVFPVIVLGLAFDALATGSAPPAASPVNPGTPVPPLILSGHPADQPAGTRSAGVAEILKMLDAKVNAQVILAYIQISTVLCNPNATELIALRDHGATTEMLTALLHHDDELRLSLAQAQSTDTAPPPPAPAYDETPVAPVPAYPSDDSEASYPPYPTTYYACACWWPWLWNTPVCNSYRPYWYHHGRWDTGCGSARPPGDGGHRSFASAPPSAARARQAVSVPTFSHPGTRTASVAHSGFGHTSAGTASVTRSGGARGSGRPGGRSR